MGIQIYNLIEKKHDGPRLAVAKLLNTVGKDSFL